MQTNLATVAQLAAHGHTKADVGLGNVDDVSAASLRDRSTHTGTQPASTVTGLAAVATSGNAADLTGQLGTSQLPPLAINETFVVVSQAAMLALAAQRGDVAVRTDFAPARLYILVTDAPGTLGDWREMTAAGSVVSVAGKSGAVVLAKADVGLGSVDNTSDASKPVSAAVQAELDNKAPLVSPNFVNEVRVGGALISPDADRIRVKKAAPSTRSSTVMTAEPDLTVTLAAGQEWFMRWCWRCAGDVANDGKLSIQGPSDADILGGQVCAQYTGGAAQNESITSLPTTVYIFGTSGGSLVVTVFVWMRVVLPTGGTISFSFARNADTVPGTPLTILEKSWVMGDREA